MRSSFRISTQLINSIIQSSKPFGVNIDEVYKNCNFDDSKPNSFIDENAENRIWKELINQSGNENIGILLGESLPFHGMGLIGYLMVNSSDAFTAMKKLCEYEKIVGTTSQKTIERKGNEIHFNILRNELVPERRHPIESVLVFTQKSIKELTGLNIKPLQINFQFNKPHDISEYHRIFPDTKFVFDCNVTTMIFDLSLSRAAIIGSNKALFAIFEQQVIDTINELDYSDNIIYKVQHLILEMMKRDKPTVYNIASELNLSVRNLQMKIKSEGSSFSKIFQEIRLKLSINYINNEKYNISDIAFLLGFSDVSVFSRTFKKWTGKSPLEFRNNNP